MELRVVVLAPAGTDPAVLLPDAVASAGRKTESHGPVTYRGLADPSALPVLFLRASSGLEAHEFTTDAVPRPDDLPSTS